MGYANSRLVKLAMDMSSMIGVEETQRQEEIHVRLEREERAKARGQFRKELAASMRNIMIFLVGAVVVLFCVLNSGRFQDFSGQVGQRLTAQASAHSAQGVLKQTALDYQNEVDEITK